MAPDKDILSKLSSRDIEVLVCALYCQKTEPQIDYNSLAARAGFKNSASAAACYRPIKNKLDAFIAAKDAENAGLPAPPSTPAPKKRKSNAAVKGEGEDGTPAAKKRARARPTKTQAVKKEEPEMKQEDDEQGETEVSPVRSFDEMMEESALGDEI